MVIKKVQNIQTQKFAFLINENGKWKMIDTEHQDLVDILEFIKKNDVVCKDYNKDDYKDVIPLKPASYRDFMLYEVHAINGARGFVKKYLSNVYPMVALYEKLTGSTFPALKPSKRFYKYPIFYMGNHLNFFSEGDKISIPSYTKELDYELEIAAIITKPLKNATPQEVNDAIGGFVILNDFSARDQQMSEMKSGFGPMKTKNFANAISCTVATSNVILPKLKSLKVNVYINDKLIASNTTAGIKYSMQEAIAYASWEEQLHPGELFGSGTIPFCTGIENGHLLKVGDKVRLEVDGIGYLTNYIV